MFRRRTRPGPCFVGSVKSNIGHLESAAGMAGLIKTILCLKHRAIPATLHYTSPNPELHLDQGPFVVRSEYGPWEWDGIRRAGVSSFGVGGTNAHVVLEEAPAVSPPSPRPVRRCCCCRLEPPRRCSSRAPRWPPNCPARTRPHCPTSPTPSNAAGRKPPAWPRSSPTGRTRQRCSPRKNTTTCSSVNRCRAPTTRTESFFCSRARALSTSGWRGACTNPSRCLPSTSISAPRGSVRSWVSICARRCSTEPRETWSAPTAPNRRCSRWNMRSRS